MIELTPLAEVGIAGIAIAAMYFNHRTSNGAIDKVTDVVKNNTKALSDLQGVIKQNHKDLLKEMKRKR